MTFVAETVISKYNVHKKLLWPEATATHKYL